MSDSDSSDDGMVQRVQNRRKRQEINRDDSDDETQNTKRMRGANRANKRHRQRAERHSDTDDSSDTESDTDTKRVMKKKQPAAANGINRAERSSDRRKKLKATQNLAKKRKQRNGNNKGGAKNKDTSDLAFDIDKEDMASNVVLQLEERTDFFKMQGSGLGLDDTAPLLSVGDFGLSVESVIQEAQLESKMNGGSNASNNSNSTSAKARKAWVYVENMATGRFKRVHMGRLGYSRLLDRDSDHDGDQNLEGSLTGPELMDNATHSITALVAGVFQFAQGLLAGLALLHLFLVTSITQFGTFTSVYQPLSNESRRLYFVLASLGLSSAIETFLRERSNKELWGTLSPSQKVRILLTCFLYLLSCGFSLGMMPIDAQIANGVATDNLALWNIFEYIRSLSSILGWILVCIGIHEENQNGRRLLIHCSSLRTDLDTQKVRLQNMSGKHLDSASPDELEDLVVIQRAAVKSTERAIEFYRKRTEARGGRASPKKGIGSFGSPAKV